jgi:succinate dehydrogenase/fumarate reductase-like Fe-S protein
MRKLRGPLAGAVPPAKERPRLAYRRGCRMEVCPSVVITTTPRK